MLAATSTSLQACAKRHRLTRASQRRLVVCVIAGGLVACGTLLAVLLRYRAITTDLSLQAPAGPARPSLTVVTFASHNANFLCHLLYTGALFQLKVKVVGFRGAAPDDVLFEKIPVTLDELRQHDPDDIVMFVDAYDVLLVDTEANIVDKFLAMNEPVVFTAEKGCWPFMDGRPDGERICQDEYPASPTPYRYLNSGGWIGYAGAAVKAFEEMMALPEASAKAIDQELASLVLLHGRARVALDHRASIFQSVHLSVDDLVVEHEPSQGNLDSRWRNRVTGTYPSVLHFNGNGKGHQAEMERAMRLDFDFDRLDRLYEAGFLAAPADDLIQGLSVRQECSAGRRPQQ
ncbi:DUF5672 domain-containing protein [Plasmodiophora brassicae]|uniref:PLOD1-3-like GT domain-containing protein n=1 Tax=Plasmodiophora brassicae TaxID=37360 RepID=A0A0G4J4R5_PLABS|nr:hypothetical protein PBRA_008948 [Plasmodiophora brassicae]